MHQKDAFLLKSISKLLFYINLYIYLFLYTLKSYTFANIKEHKYKTHTINSMKV